MHNLNHINDVLILLGVAIFIVVLMYRIKVSPVLGYLIAGAVMGSHGLNIIENADFATKIADFGVIFLLFVIGLELTIERLINMRWHVFGLGGLQVTACASVIALIVAFYLKLSFLVSTVIGVALASSSTAIVLQVLAENKSQSTRVGRVSLAVLLMQDLAVVPLLSLVPVLSYNQHDIMQMIGITSLKSLAMIFAIIIIGKLILRPFFSLIVSAKKDEIYVTTALFIVLGSAWLTAYMGLSPAMGAFLSGLLIAETEYRHKIEESIMPFQGLFLALFFVTVGMSIDVDFIIKNLRFILVSSLLLLLVKTMVIFFVCRLFGLKNGSSIYAALLLSQGGEFAFILASMLSHAKVISHKFGQQLLMIVACTMAVTPLLALLGMRIERMFSHDKAMDCKAENTGGSHMIGHVVIAGFGRVGRVVAFMLQENGIDYIAIDSNTTLVRKARKQGFNVYHGDISRKEDMDAANLSAAIATVITISDTLTTARVTKTIRRKLPKMPMVVRVEDYRHSNAILKLGASTTIPVTVETGIEVGSSVLRVLEVSEDNLSDTQSKIRRNQYSIIGEVELFKDAGVSSSRGTS